MQPEEEMFESQYVNPLTNNMYSVLLHVSFDNSRGPYMECNTQRSNQHQKMVLSIRPKH
jgi:hypothetical protein